MDNRSSPSINEPRPAAAASSGRPDTSTGSVRRYVAAAVSAGAAILGLYWLGRQNYLLFHGLIEIFSITVAWGVFVLVWNSRRLVENQALVALGICFAFIGLLDLLHTLAYRGMGVLGQPADANLPTQLWIAARYLQAGAFLAFPRMYGRRPRPASVFAILALATALLLAAIFAWKIFPVCYVEGLGLTAFKTTSEYVICILHVVALLCLRRRRAALDGAVYRSLAIAIGLSIAGGLSFTLYTDVYGLFNFIGHLFKAGAFAMVYRGLIHIGLTRPAALLYRELERSRERYRLVADFTWDWEYWVDAAGTFLYVSPSCERVSGHPPAFFLDNPDAFLNIVAPEDRSRLAAHMGNSAEAEAGTCELEFRIVRGDGEIRWINHTCWGVYTDDGIYVGRRGSNRDITTRKQAQSALKDSEERFRTAFENASVGMAIVGFDGIYQQANAAMAQMIGYRPEELIGKPVADFTHQDDQQRRSQLIDDLLAGKIRSGEQERRFVHRNGATVTTHLWATVQHDHNEKPLYFLSLLKNISGQKQAETEKIKMEGQLHQAQKMEAIGTLAGGIAHDFNNILSVIIGNAEMLNLKEEIAPSLRQNVAPILAASNRAKKLVGQILTFSRQGQQQKLLINLKPVIKETIEFLRASLPTSIQIEHFIGPEAGTILADPTQMQQILMNLCTNAAHAMEDGGGALKIELGNATVTEADSRLTAGLEPGRYVKLSVSDTGHGMEAWVRERIFDPYFTTKGLGKGTGLGLSVVHGIVESHGGVIKVYSEPGRGTTFHVYLPRTDGVEEAESRPAQPLPRGAETILIVDDETALANIAKRMLEFLGYQVEVRTSPVEALELIRADPQRFDAVITDLTMPQMTGLNLGREILAIRPGMPIILCTGFSDLITEGSVRSAGISAVLTKPVLLADLGHSLRRSIDEGGARKAGSRSEQAIPPARRII